MNDALEQVLAESLHRSAMAMASRSAKTEDHHATTMAILMHAFILATPQLTAERRAGLFLENEE